MKSFLCGISGRIKKKTPSAPCSACLFPETVFLAAAGSEGSMNRLKNEHHTSFCSTPPISELQRYGLEEKKRNWKMNLKNK